MTSQALALYDFSGDPATGELTFSAGEVLLVTNKNVAEGWWEGQKSDGTVGYFPQAYVQEDDGSFLTDSSLLESSEISSKENAVKQEQFGFSQDPFQQTEAAFQQDPFKTDASAQDPFQEISNDVSDDPFGDFPASSFQNTPQPQSANSNQQNLISNDVSDDPFGDFPASSFQNTPQPQSANSNQQNLISNDTSNDPFGDFPVSSQNTPQPQSANSNEQNLLDNEPDYIDMTTESWDTSTPGFVSPPVPASPQTSPTTPSQASLPSPTSEAPSPIKRTNTFKMSIFSSITKSAGKSYVVGESKVDISNSRISPIVMGPDGPMWQNATNVFFL